MGLSATSRARHEGLNYSQRASSARSSSLAKPTRAVLSIKPEYAEAIFDGRKRFEFRRSVFREDISVVIVYMSSPVMQVVGEFSVEGIITNHVDALWDQTEAHAGIGRQAFMDYFAGRDVGHAIKIGSVKRYDPPRNLQQAYGVRPPQSFLYLKDTSLWD
jgi:predicted transcriptional regulator